MRTVVCALLYMLVGVSCLLVLIRTAYLDYKLLYTHWYTTLCLIGVCLMTLDALSHLRYLETKKYLGTWFSQYEEPPELK